MAKVDPRPIETDRTKALIWWNTLPMYDADKLSKRVLSNLHYGREPKNLTGREIEKLWHICLDNYFTCKICEHNIPNPSGDSLKYKICPECLKFDYKEWLVKFNKKRIGKYLHDKTQIHIDFETKQHNRAVEKSIKIQRIINCPQDCFYLINDRHIQNTCMFCFNNSKYKKNEQKSEDNI